MFELSGARLAYSPARVELIELKMSESYSRGFLGGSRPLLSVDSPCGWPVERMGVVPGTMPMSGRALPLALPAWLLTHCTCADHCCIKHLPLASTAETDSVA